MDTTESITDDADFVTVPTLTADSEEGPVSTISPDTSVTESVSTAAPMNNTITVDQDILLRSIPRTDIVDETETATADDDAYIIPIKIILPVTHVHAVPENNTFERFEFIVLRTGDPHYHEHLPNDFPDVLLPDNQTFEGNGTDFENVTVVSSDGRTLVDQEGYRYQRTKLNQIPNELGDVVHEFEDITEVRTFDAPATTARNSKESVEPMGENDEKYDEHYGKILKWIHYYL